MTNHGHKAIFFLLKHSSDIEIENDKCIFMLIMAMWITLYRQQNNAKFHQSEGCVFFLSLGQE